MDTVARLKIVPPLQRVQVGENQISVGRGIVHDRRGGHGKPNLGHSFGKAGCTRHGMDGIRLVENQHVHRAGVHGGGQFLERAVTVTLGTATTEVDGLSDVAGDVVENVDGGADFGGAAVLTGDAAGNRHTWVRGKLPGNRADGLRRQAALFSRTFGGEWGQHRAEGVGVIGCSVTLGQNDVGHRQCHRRVGSGVGGVPLVGIHPGEVHAVAEVHVLGHVAVVEAVRLGKTALVLHLSQPRLQEVGAERQDVLGSGEIVARHFVPAEHLLVGRPERLVVERLVTHQTAAEGTHPGGQEIRERPRSRSRNDRYRGPGGTYPLGQEGDRIVP